MTPDESILVNIVRPASIAAVQVADGLLLKVHGSGSVNLTVWHGQSIETAQLSDVLLVPELKVCLLSVPALQRLGLTVTFGKKGATIADKNGNLLHASMDTEAGITTVVSDINSSSSPIAMALLGHRVNDGSRPIHLDESVGSTTTESQSVAGRRQDDIPQQVAQGAITPPAGSSDGQKRRAPEAIGGVRGLILRWHRRLGHPGRFAMRSFAKVAEVGITPQSVSAFFKDTQVCDTCVEAKMARLPFYSSTNRATSALDLVHADLVGPVRPTDTVTPGAPLYVLTIVDDYSRKYWAIPLVRKSDAFSQLKVWAKRESVQQERSVKKLRTDGGGEFGSKACEEWCNTEGIARQLTAPYSSMQNGVVERANRTLQDRARAMLMAARADLAWWPLAVTAAVYQLNRTPNTAIENDMPERKWTGRIRISRCCGCGDVWRG